MEKEKQTQMKMIKLDDLKPHPDNPRKISDDALKLLKNKIQSFTEMLEVRPIVYDEDKIIWGGNKRYEALVMLEYKEIPTKWTHQIIGWTVEEKKKFMLIDNIHDGSWDGDILNNSYWSGFIIKDLGDFVLNAISDARGYDETMLREIVEPTQKTTINLRYKKDVANIVKQELLKIAKTPEEAVYKLIQDV